MDAVEFVFGWKNNDQRIFLISTKHGKIINGQIAIDVFGLTFLKGFPRVVIFLGKDKYTHDLILKSRIFSVCLLSQKQNSLVERFGISSGRDIEKFKGIKYRESSLGNPIVEGCSAWMDCQVIDSMDLGDHTSILGLIKENGFNQSVPLTVSYFLENSSKKTLERLDKMTKRSIHISEKFLGQYNKRKNLK